ncbi:hypothetical protein M8C21_008287, partial [Ambrosia artemisiifolia]
PCAIHRLYLMCRFEARLLSPSFSFVVGYEYNGLDTKVEKSRKQLKERKNRAKKIRCVKKPLFCSSRPNCSCPNEHEGSVLTIAAPLVVPDIVQTTTASDNAYEESALFCRLGKV